MWRVHPGGAGLCMSVNAAGTFFSATGMDGIGTLSMRYG